MQADTRNGVCFIFRTRERGGKLQEKRPGERQEGTAIGYGGQFCQRLRTLFGLIFSLFNRPEKPNPCKTTLRASSVPSRITCETRTSLCRR